MIDIEMLCSDIHRRSTQQPGNIAGVCKHINKTFFSNGAGIFRNIGRSDYPKTKMHCRSPGVKPKIKIIRLPTGEKVEALISIKNGRRVAKIIRRIR